MLNSKKLKNASLVIFLLVQVVFWVFVVFSKTYTHYFTYASVVASFVYVLATLPKTRVELYQILAFAFTLVADYFLILKWNNYDIAMCFFLVVQLFYSTRVFLLAKSKKEKAIQGVLHGVVSVVAIILCKLVLKEGANLLAVVSVVYYFNLLVSLVFSFVHFKDSKTAKLLAFGLLCFALCDIHVGFETISNMFNLSAGNFIYDLSHMEISLVKIFYPPSQTLLALGSKY